MSIPKWMNDTVGRCHRAASSIVHLFLKGVRPDHNILITYFGNNNFSFLFRVKSYILYKMDLKKGVLIKTNIESKRLYFTKSRKR